MPFTPPIPFPSKSSSNFSLFSGLKDLAGEREDIVQHIATLKNDREKL